MSDYITRDEFNAKMRRVLEAGDDAAFDKYNPWEAALAALDAEPERQACAGYICKLCGTSCSCLMRSHPREDCVCGKPYSAHHAPQAEPPAPAALPEPDAGTPACEFSGLESVVSAAAYNEMYAAAQMQQRECERLQKDVENNVKWRRREVKRREELEADLSDSKHLAADFDHQKRQAAEWTAQAAKEREAKEQAEAAAVQYAVKSEQAERERDEARAELAAMRAEYNPLIERNAALAVELAAMKAQASFPVLELIDIDEGRGPVVECLTERELYTGQKFFMIPPDSISLAQHEAAMAEARREEREAAKMVCRTLAESARKVGNNFEAKGDVNQSASWMHREAQARECERLIRALPDDSETNKEGN